MERVKPGSRFTVICIIISAVALSTHPTDARGLQRPSLGRYDPPSSIDSDAELLRALDFLDRYERAKNRGSDDTSGFFYGDRDTTKSRSPKAKHILNGIPPMQDIEYDIRYRPLKWDDEEDVEEPAMEDLFPPRPEDLETNEMAFARAALDSYMDYESDKKRKLFEKILGDVMAEKMLQEDEEKNIVRLLEEQEDEEKEVDDLAAIFSPSSSSITEDEAYGPKEVASSIFSASSEEEGEREADRMLELYHSSDAEVVPDVGEDNFFISEGGLEVLDQAEKILDEGYEESENNEWLPDFDDTSDLTSFFPEEEEEEVGSDVSDVGGPPEEEKQEILKDIIYRIVQDTLRRKLGESVNDHVPSDSDEALESSIADGGSSAEPGATDDDERLDELVDEIREEVDRLSSKIMRKINGESNDPESDTSSSESREILPDVDASSSDGYFNDQPADEASSLMPDDVIAEVMNGVSPSSREEDLESLPTSSVFNDEEIMREEDLINAIRAIVPDETAVEQNACPVLDYILDDCSVVDGLRGLGSGGYSEAFGRPCNRHQLCYTCSTSYGIPTNLCDEIYKAELLTLCNGNPECKQRAKYFWLAATNDRTPPNFPLSVCSDRCVLDYLLSD